MVEIRELHADAMQCSAAAIQHRTGYSRYRSRRKVADRDSALRGGDDDDNNTMVGASAREWWSSALYYLHFFLHCTATRETRVRTTRPFQNGTHLLRPAASAGARSKMDHPDCWLSSFNSHHPSFMITTHHLAMSSDADTTRQKC
ncbi:hypothetical protein HYALB_00010750 [Hymenoscyphus albidus]|uniref:Uncharacterized protein n=1 Tax=Hymenoscyphus albidus TaxID=595503 RepID=A0A9N9Q4B1_9HELO|nr:hypothetical protein HYALB_00010750 [Hymenoscyphus albidus]